MPSWSSNISKKLKLYLADCSVIAQPKALGLKQPFQTTKKSQVTPESTTTGIPGEAEIRPALLIIGLCQSVCNELMKLRGSTAVPPENYTALHAETERPIRHH